MAEARSAPRNSPHLLLALFWARHWIVARAVPLEVTPVGRSFWRWSTAIAVFAALAGRRLAHDWPVVRAHWWCCAFFSGVTGIVALPIFRERIGARAVLGIAVSFCGVLAIVSRLSLVRLLDFRFNPGELYLLGNVSLWALDTVCLRCKPPTLPHLSFLLACALFAMVPMLPPYAADVLAGGRVELAWGTVLGIAPRFPVW